MAQIIDGKKVSAQVKEQVREEAAQLKASAGLQVGLAVVIVGNNPASRVYVNNKKKACEAVGFQSFEYALEEVRGISRASALSWRQMRRYSLREVIIR